jgi:hypothetical protein
MQIGELVKKLCEDELSGNDPSVALPSLSDENTFAVNIQQTTLLLKMQRLRALEEEMDLVSVGVRSQLSQVVRSYLLELEGCRKIVKDLNKIGEA